MTITTEEAEALARFYDISKELYSDNPEDSGTCAMHHLSAAALRSLAGERDALRAKNARLRGALLDLLTPQTPASFAGAMKNARAALGETQ